MLNHEEFRKILIFLKKYQEMDYAIIKKNMRYLRSKRGVTPFFFEKNDLLTVDTVKMLEKLSYKYKPSLESLIKYCYGLGIELEDLLKDYTKNEDWEG